MRIVDTWRGGAAAWRQWEYRLVEDAGRYELLARLVGTPTWEPVEYGHLVAQRMAGHLIIEERERQRRERRRA